MLTDELKALIDDADVVSFDVFDTLLLRRHYAPTDVFAHGKRGGRFFRFVRVAAEILARRLHRNQHDITLKQIYALLRRSPDPELLAERQTLFCNPAARDIYDYAVATGKRVIAISDMYLPQDFLREAVQHAGYTHLHKLYVSCEAGVTKFRGELYHHVANDLSVTPNRILHIGDNEHSDVIRARERGVIAWHLPSPRFRFETKNRVHPAIVRYLRRGRQPHHSLLLGILRDGLADTEDSEYRLGFSVVGPIANAFADRLHERGERTGLPLIAKILSIRYGESGIAHDADLDRRLLSEFTTADDVQDWFHKSSGTIHDGAIDFTHALLERQAAGYPIRVSPTDVAAFLSAIGQSGK